MLLTNRNYKRVKPHRESKKLIIFAEGLKREVEYFRKLQDLDSRLNIIIYNLKSTEDNSPVGLLNLAQECIAKSEINGEDYEFSEDMDELWFLIDTDTWGKKIDELRTEVAKKESWFIAQSNPCFEVWLYWHFFDCKPDISELELCNAWKRLLDKKIKGGFNSDKHIFFINFAVENAKTNYLNKRNPPNYSETEVYKLAEKITRLLGKKFNSVLNKAKMNHPNDYLQ